MRRLSIAIVLALAACSPAVSEAGLSTSVEPEATTSSPTTSEPLQTTTPPDDEVITSGDLDIVVLPRDGALPPDLLVQCPSGPAFPFGALTSISSLDDSDPEGYLDAIAPFLANEEGQFWPQEGWRLLHRAEGTAILVAPTEDGNLAYMHVKREDGKWLWEGSSINGNPCVLQYTVPEGLNTVQWELDPAAELNPGSTEVDVLLTERDCASGLEIGERLLGPEVVMTPDSVHIAFAAEPPPGELHTCPGIEPQPFVVTLPAPMGERSLVPGMSIGHNLEDYLD